MKLPWQGSSILKLLIHKRLQQIIGVSDDVTFGNLPFIAVGDLYELPTVGQKTLFAICGDGYSKFFGSGSL